MMATVLLEEPAAVPEVGAGDCEEEAVVMEAKEEGEEKAKEAGEGAAKKPEGVGEQRKEKKPRSRKARSEQGAHHPPYFEMIKEAIMAAGDGKAAEASTYAIAKRVGERHGEALPGNYRKVLAVQLRNLAAKGRLVRVKASFRLAPAEEKAAKKRRGTATKKKTAPKEGKKAAPARAKRAKKVAPPAKTKTKQARSIRSGVARKANKASA